MALSSLLFYPPQKTEAQIAALTAQNAAVPPLVYSDPDRVLECMQRALKVARAANPNLFIEMLDRYGYGGMMYALGVAGVSR